MKSVNEMGQERNNPGLTSMLGSFRGREFQKEAFYGDVNLARKIGPVINCLALSANWPCSMQSLRTSSHVKSISLLAVNQDIVRFKQKKKRVKPTELFDISKLK